MSAGDGNGWVMCPLGHRHWGRHGAAGLLLLRQAPAGPPSLPPGPCAADPLASVQALMQLRATWTDAGGTWGLPGGAADSHESEQQAALREAQEEAGLDPGALDVLAQVVTTDHGTWRYTTVLATPSRPVDPRAANEESQEMTWIRLPEVDRLLLHRGFAESWPTLRAAVQDISGLVRGG